MTTPAIRQVAPAKLAPDPNQPRKAFPEASLRELADSIKARGMLQPILVTEGAKKQLIILDGERRWRVAKTLKLKTVPVIVSKDVGDATQRGIDQIAANNIRADLSIMDRAQWLKARQDEGKTPNEIAATMAKAGMKAIDQKHVEQLVRLCALPEFAKQMIDAGEMKPGDAQQLEVLTRAGVPKEALEIAAKELRQSANLGGQVEQHDVGDAVLDAMSKVAIDLTTVQSWQTSRDRPGVYFNHKTRCKGCEHYVQRAGAAWCLSRKLFEEHNQEAQDAGLRLGGERPKQERAPSPAQEKRDAADKTEQQQRSLRQRTADYLRAWLIDRVLEQLPKNAGLQAALADFAALGWPAAYVSHSMDEAAEQLKLNTLGDFLTPTYLAARPADVYPTIAARVVLQLDLSHITVVAKLVLGPTLDGLWKVDGAFLKLLRKPALIAIAEQHATLPDGRRSWATCKASELHAAILAAADHVPVAPMLADLYAEKAFEDEPDLDEGDGDVDLDDDQDDDHG